MSKLVGSARGRLGHARDTARVKAWRREAQARGCLIDHSIQFTGTRSPATTSLGNGVVIEDGLVVWVAPDAPDPRLGVGSGTFIGRHSHIAVHAPVTIGRDGLIGAYSYIMSCNHQANRRDIPIRLQGFSAAPVVIEDDVWIGTHAVVLPGAQLRRGCIIAAGAVVRTEVPEYEVWGGVPARKISERP